MHSGDLLMGDDEYFVHESSYVDEGVDIGAGTKIWHFSHIQSGAKIGKNCSIGQNVNIGNNAVIGNFVKIQNNVSIYEGVIIEDYVFCGPSMVFTNILNPRGEYPQKGTEHYRKTVVKRGASLGANSTIVCGHTIGKRAFVGAGAVVTKDVPDYALVIGNPAVIAGWVCACGSRLDFRKEVNTRKETVCVKCGKKYKKTGPVVEETG
jgi:UDP-2-acetamido-3-amino-2,3-dideoxy-glucuronate N-acetyltransferase